MNLSAHGTNTLDYEITNIEKNGFWLLAENHEYFISFQEYPVFKDGKIKEILNITRPSPSHFHWPDLDADIELEALKKPEKFVLRYR